MSNLENQVKDEIIEKLSSVRWSLGRDLCPSQTKKYEAAVDDAIIYVRSSLSKDVPIQMIMTCPLCGARHIDEGEFATKPHHTHACQSCGNVWRPAIGPTVGVQFLPGFKNGDNTNGK